MIVTNKKGEPITTTEEWFQLAPPAGGQLHWQEGRSARELAKDWMTSNGPAMPIELADLLSTQPDTGDFQPEWAIPEYETKLDGHSGKGRQHDLIVSGDANGKKTLIAIEAKADEPFKQIVSVYMTNSVARNPRTKVPDRIKQLAGAIFGDEDVAMLRYQLIHAVAGTLIEAKNQEAAQAVFVVYTFKPQGETSRKFRRNEEDLQSFMEKLTGNPLPSGKLVGPIHVPGGGFVPGDIPLYIGKIEKVIG